ncbi:MAG: hypothetical protein IJX03_01870 [Clostridia bacterium]|nr:hypothetical protein [Clostridia bacterium]
MANTLLGIEELFVAGSDGINGVELMNAIEYSGWKGGEPVTIPVDGKKYLEELNKRRKTSKLKVSNDSAVTNTEGTY